MNRSFFTATAFALFTLSPALATAEAYCSQAQTRETWQSVSAATFQSCIDEGEQFGRDIDGIGEAGMTVLELAVASSNDPTIVQRVLDLGADPNLLGGEYDLRRPVGLAAYAETPDMSRQLITILVDAGADLNALNSQGTPAYADLLTYVGGQPVTVEFIDFLVEKGADFSLSPNPEGGTEKRKGWFYYGLVTGADRAILEKLYELGGGAMNVDVGGGSTYLHVVAFGGGHANPDAVDWLIEMGADPTIKDGSGKYAWERTTGSVSLAAKLQKAAGFEPDGGIPGLATKDQIAQICREKLASQASSFARDGVGVGEVCGCVEQYAAIKYERVSTHPNFNKIIGSKSPDKQMDAIIGPLAFACVAIYTNRP